MVFASYSFLFYFIPVLILTYYILPVRFRNGLLLAFSLAFYAWGGPVYLLVMLLSVFINYVMGIAVFFTRDNSTKQKSMVFLSILLNLLLLGYFKYFNFILDSINAVFYTGLEIHDIALPVGISFYTFQGLSYVIDVKNGRGVVHRNPLRVALYISLFPQLIAGPIVRYETIEAELDFRQADKGAVSYGMKRFIVGLAKKILFANEFGKIADQYFSLCTGDLSIVTAWIGAVAYTLQIYYDFSGYSDMAIGLGRIFGFHFPENFNYPYIAESITEFWRRWHISLSTWFRDYVYIPLGGNQCGKVRHILNLLIVWTLTGIWHGASWNFLAWGVYYALLLILEKVYLMKYLKRIPPVVRCAYTMFFVIIGWVIFRAGTIKNTYFFLGSMFDIHTNSDLFLIQAIRFLQDNGLWFLFGIMFATPFVKDSGRKVKCYLNDSCSSALYTSGCTLLLFMCIIKLVVSSYNPFIYFRF